MPISAIIPTYRRPEKIAACVACLARQTLEDDRYEVLVGLDGGAADDPETTRATISAIEGAWASAGGHRGGLRVVPCPRLGIGPVRNTLMGMARGDSIVTLNDDVLPEAEFLAAHETEHVARRASGRGAMIVGDSPWMVHRPDRLFDRLIRETSMVFFYDEMHRGAGEPQRDWGPRNAYGLNTSFPRSAAMEIGGFMTMLHYGYEDLEFAHRMKLKFDMPVLFRPAARAPHNHRMDPREYAAREYKLGYAAFAHAKANHEFGRFVFGRDITDDDELSYSRAFVEREVRGAAESMRLLEESARTPASAADGEHGGMILRTARQQQVFAKRWLWRVGLLDACLGREPLADGALARLAAGT